MKSLADFDLRWLLTFFNSSSTSVLRSLANGYQVVFKPLYRAQLIDRFELSPARSHQYNGFVDAAISSGKYSMTMAVLIWITKLV